MQMGTEKNIQDVVTLNFWSDDIERVLESIRFNSILLSREHKKQYIALKNVLKYYRLPVIIISALNSVISVSAQPYIEQSYISLITCGMALICGIIGSVEMYFAIQVKMETELMASKDYYILGTDIYKMSQLDRGNRGVNGKSFLDQSYSQYIKLTESSCIIVKRVEDKMAIIEPNKLFANKQEQEQEQEKSIKETINQSQHTSINKTNSVLNYDIEGIEEIDISSIV